MRTSRQSPRHRTNLRCIRNRIDETRQLLQKRRKVVAGHDCGSSSRHGDGRQGRRSKQDARSYANEPQTPSGNDVWRPEGRPRRGRVASNSGSASWLHHGPWRRSRFNGRIDCGVEVSIITPSRLKTHNIRTWNFEMEDQPGPGASRAEVTVQLLAFWPTLRLIPLTFAPR